LSVAGGNFYVLHAGYGRSWISASATPVTHTYSVTAFVAFVNRKSRILLFLFGFASFAGVAEPTLAVLYIEGQRKSDSLPKLANFF
jgi:hypothetical protein